MATSTPASVSPAPSETRDVARQRVRHYAADFSHLEARFPGRYPRLFVRGEGIYLFDSDGHRVIDAGNHLGACVVGHARQDMAEAIAEQIRVLEFSSLEAGASHGYVTALAERLDAVVPVPDAVFSFVNSGSEANEFAIKIAREFHRRNGESGRSKILSRQGSYHGSSYAAMSATAIPGFREQFQPLVPGFVPMPQPFPGFCGQCELGEECSLACVDTTIDLIEREDPSTIAAVLAEPISIPGAVKVPVDGYWQRLREACDEHGILLIVDEVVNGFGRTGRMFGIEHWGVVPDIVTLAKGLTSGYVPMGAAAVSPAIDAAFRDSPPMVHVNTYAGHAVACAAAMASLQIIEREDLVARAAAHEPTLRRGLEQVAAQVDVVTRVSVKGLLGSIEFELPTEIDAENVRADLWHQCYEHGVVVRATRAGQRVSLFFYPPLVIDDAQLRDGLQRVGHAVQAIAEQIDHGTGPVEVPS